MKTLSKYRPLILSLLMLMPTIGLAESAQDETIRAILEVEETTQSLMKKKGDKVDMSTPLSSLVFLKKALDEEDYEAAGAFLDMRYLPEEIAEFETRELLLQLRYVWGRQEILDINTISDHIDGHRDDGLPDYREQIGTVHISSGAIPSAYRMAKAPGYGKYLTPLSPGFLRCGTNWATTTELNTSLISCQNSV